MLYRIPLIPDYFFFCLPSSAFFVFQTSQLTQDTSISTNTGIISTNTADIDTLEVNMIQIPLVFKYQERTLFYMMSYNKVDMIGYIFQIQHTDIDIYILYKY